MIINTKEGVGRGSRAVCLGRDRSVRAQLAGWFCWLGRALACVLVVRISRAAFSQEPVRAPRARRAAPGPVIKHRQSGG